MTGEIDIPAVSADLTKRISVYLLSLEEGERLLTVRELAALCEASVGSISNALSSLEQSGAVRISRRGHLGSFLEARSVGDLWNAARDEPVVVANPLPSSRRYEGLAAGLKKLLQETGVQAFMIFQRGSLARMEALRKKRCHIAVMSTFAAERLCTENEEIVMNLPPGSFLSGHKVYYRPRVEPPDAPLRVAIDRASYDHFRLTELEFADQNVVFVETNFMQIRQLLASGAVDASMWTVDEMGELPSGVLSRPPSEKVLEIIDDTDKMTALVIRAEDHVTRALVRAAIDPDALMAFQQAVLTGEVVPDY